MTIHEIIDMITVGYRFMAATWTMNVSGFMASAAVVWRTDGRICV